MSSKVGARSIFNTGAWRSRVTWRQNELKPSLQTHFYILQQMQAKSVCVCVSVEDCWRPAVSASVWFQGRGPWVGSWCQIHTAASYQWAERTDLRTVKTGDYCKAALGQETHCIQSPEDQRRGFAWSCSDLCGNRCLRCRRRRCCSVPLYCQVSSPPSPPCCPRTTGSATCRREHILVFKVRFKAFSPSSFSFLLVLPLGEPPQSIHQLINAAFVQTPGQLWPNLRGPQLCLVCKLWLWTCNYLRPYDFHLV